VLVLTYRTDEMHRRHPAVRAPGLAEGGERVGLAGVVADLLAEGESLLEVIDGRSALAELQPGAAQRGERVGFGGSVADLPGERQSGLQGRYGRVLVTATPVECAEHQERRGLDPALTGLPTQGECMLYLFAGAAQFALLEQDAGE
jgi:hypothetical protein